MHSEGGEIYLKKDIESSIQVVNNFISALIQGTDNQFTSMVGDKPTLQTIIQVLHGTKLSDDCQRGILSIILNHAFLAEKISPGSFEETIKIISSFLSGKKEIINNKNALFSKRPTKEQIRSFLASRSHDSKFLSIIDDALSLAGYGGKIIVEKSISGTTSVELCRGYTFNVSPAWPLTAKFDSPKVTVIDGYVENVSEIHHLLEIASEKKDTILIFSRGMSADVIHTLKVNYDRGTLKVIPIIVKFDVEGINTVNDVAIVSGCDMISSRKGDLISSIKYDSLPTVDYAFIYPTKAVIQNQKTHLDVEAQVRNLRDKQAENNVDDISDLLEKRIRSLSPNHVVIRIPDDKDYVKNSQFIDTSLRSIRSIIDHGIHDSDGIIQPATVTVTSRIYAKKCIDIINSVGSMIMLFLNLSINLLLRINILMSC